VLPLLQDLAATSLNPIHLIGKGKPSLREQNLPSGMLRRLTRNGAAPQSQIAHTDLMFPTLLHASGPYLTRLRLCRSKYPSCLVDHALSTCGHVDPKHGIITSGRAARSHPQVP
jgi:hypothetical protein